MTNATKGEAPTLAGDEASISNQTYQRKTDMINFNASTPSPATAEPLTTVTSAAATAFTALVPVFSGTIQGHAVQLCDARTLHTFMGVLRDFTTWVKGRIHKFGFVEDVDFLRIIGSPDLGNQTRGGNKKDTVDYHLTIGMAKELSMVENNAKGREARRYFMECEKQVLAALTSHPTDRIPYSVNPTDTLSAAQAEQLRMVLKDKCDTLPKGEQAAFMTKGWSKLKSHFGCTYRKIQQREFSEAVSLATRHAAEWQAVELDAPDQPQTAINATDGPALKAARDVALRYFDDLRGAVKSGGSAGMGQIPTDALTGLVADALMRQRFMVTFDWCNGGMQVNPVPTDAIVCSAAQLPRMILQSDSPFSNDEVLSIARHANMRMMGAAGQIGKNEEVEQLRKTVRKLHPSYLLEVAQDAWMELGMRTALTNELGASA